LSQELELLRKQLEQQQLELDRMKAVNEIQNILAAYSAYHVANKQKETCELFCRHTVGTYAIYDTDVYNGYQGIQNHFLGRMDQGNDRTGQLYLHEMVTPCIQVAGDGQTAKCVVATIGCETGLNDDLKPNSLWSFARYRFDFAKEDGQWRIWHQRLYITFLTPFDGGGWTETPYYDIYKNLIKSGLFSQAEGGDPDQYVSYHLPSEMGGKKFSMTTMDCDILNCNPGTPKPYATWDEPIGPPNGPAIM
jgi:ketosteroid isomerase-like protein